MVNQWISASILESQSAVIKSMFGPGSGKPCYLMGTHLLIRKTVLPHEYTSVTYRCLQQRPSTETRLILKTKNISFMNLLA